MDNNDEQGGGADGSARASAGGGGGGGAGDAGEDISSEAKESGPGLLELSKPSEFRLKALKQQKYLTFNKGNATFASFVVVDGQLGVGCRGVVLFFGIGE